MQTNTVKTRYSDEELQEFKLLIEGKLEKAEKELNSYIQQLNESAENPDAKTINISDSIGLVENERLSNLAIRQKKHIQHLKNALIRIDNKVYGVCRVTGKLIAKKRLMIVPHATLSMEAKQSR